jgi:hypothetical protein
MSYVPSCTFLLYVHILYCALHRLASFIHPFIVVSTTAAAAAGSPAFSCDSVEVVCGTLVSTIAVESRTFQGW